MKNVTRTAGLGFNADGKAVVLVVPPEVNHGSIFEFTIENDPKHDGYRICSTRIDDDGFVHNVASSCIIPQALIAQLVEGASR